MIIYLWYNGRDKSGPYIWGNKLLDGTMIAVAGMVSRS